MPVAQATIVGLSTIAAATGSARFLCPGLGSCLAICALDPERNVGGIAHLMLPQSRPDMVDEQPARFVDTGMEAFINELEKQGAQRDHMLFAVVGAAQLFKCGPDSKVDIGTRNYAAFEGWVESNALNLIATDIGGNLGRSVTFTLETGEIMIRTLSEGEKKLCTLRA